MSKKVIVIRQGDKEQLYPLIKDRLLIGRDPSCDIVLEDPSISRKHAAILFRYDNIYIENISGTGQIFKKRLGKNKGIEI